MTTVTSINALSNDELSALRAAAAWYASYHATEIAAEAGDDSAYAVMERERYVTLVAGLRKLGLRIALPEGIAAPA